MLRALALPLVSLIAILSIACSRSTTPPSVIPTLAQTTTATPVSAPLPYPMKTPGSVLNTPYPAPIDTPVPARPPLPTLTPPPPPSPIPLNVISKTKLNCTPQAAFTKCSDDTLKIEFEYPATRGEIEAILRTGEIGYAYDYSFSISQPEESPAILAGGRSKDFVESRGGMLTDFMGYGAKSSQSRCADMKDFAPICREVKPDVILLMEFPEARYICDPAFGTLYAPIAIIEIDLPSNPTINGFRFVSPFLSRQLAEKLNADLRDGIGYAPDTVATKCDAVSQAEFDNRVKEIVESVRASSVDSGTSENIQRLEHIAQSIAFR